MRKYLKITLVLALLSISALTAMVFASKSKPAVAGTKTNVENSVTIRFSEKEFEKIIPYQEEMTALEATRIATGGEIVVAGSGSDANVIEIYGRSIDRIKREYWEVIINGESALINPGNLYIEPGDVIEWKVSKF